jgi:hypothetical protein
MERSLDTGKDDFGSAQTEAGRMERPAVFGLAPKQHDRMVGCHEAASIGRRPQQLPMPCAEQWQDGID